MSEPFSKDLATGSYDLVALSILNKKPSCVYEMVRGISERTNHLVRWREGMAYRVLHDLERRGLVTSEWREPMRGRQRRYYRLTACGRRALHQRRHQWHEFSNILNKLLE